MRLTDHELRVTLRDEGVKLFRVETLVRVITSAALVLREARTREAPDWLARWEEGWRPVAEARGLTLDPLGAVMRGSSEGAEVMGYTGYADGLRTVFLVRLPDDAPAGLSVRPDARNWFGRTLGREQDIETGDDSFDAEFLVGGREQPVREALDVESRARLSNLERWSDRVRVHDGRLEVWADGPIYDADKLEVGLRYCIATALSLAPAARGDGPFR